MAELVHRDKEQSDWFPARWPYYNTAVSSFHTLIPALALKMHNALPSTSDIFRFVEGWQSRNMRIVSVKFWITLKCNLWQNSKAWKGNKRYWWEKYLPLPRAHVLTAVGVLGILHVFRMNTYSLIMDSEKLVAAGVVAVRWPGHKFLVTMTGQFLQGLQEKQHMKQYSAWFF